MVKNVTGRKTSFISFRRTKPGIGAANHHHHTAIRPSANRHLTQYAFNAFSSGTLVHFSDPTYAPYFCEIRSIFVCMF
jgi:hypothetical protein